MAVSLANGTRFFVGPLAGSTTQPTTATYVEVGEIEIFGELGDAATVREIVDPADLRTKRYRQTLDGGLLAIGVFRDPNDAGQIVMRAAVADEYDDEYWFKIELSDESGAETLYFSGPVLTARDRVGVSNDPLRTTFAIGVNSAVIKG